MSKHIKSSEIVYSNFAQPPGRFLRSRRDRAALWYGADGKCESCGQPLGDDWHADHITPWSISRRTELAGMQALCAACNVAKGMRMLRRHQRDMRSILEMMVSDPEMGRTVLAWVTPGGGKSALPVIAAQTLIPKFADRICVVTPRQTLQEQMQTNFQESWLRELVRHKLEIRQATNEWDPSRDTAGYVTTYQAITQDKPNPPRMPLPANVTEFGRYRYVLVLDEAHHIDEGGAWHLAVEPLIERAVLVILMTGTLERGDGKKIARLPYISCIDDFGNAGQCVNLDGPVPVIRYSRKDALEEQSVIPLVFEHLDGVATWIDREGEQWEDIPLSLAGRRTQEALYTALKTDYARQLLIKCVEDWQAYRRQNPRSKLLVVAAKIDEANAYLSWLRELGINRADKATSDDKEALRRIARFGEHGTATALDVLVTVAMAYEGLDNPAITHVASLTHIRSRPWIEQMISRANRFDRKAGAYDKQLGWIYAPDDSLLRDIFDEIRAEQEPFLRLREERLKEEAERESRQDPRNIAAQSSTWTRSRSSDLSGNEAGYSETAIYEIVIDKAGKRGVVHPIELATMIEEVEALRQSSSFASATRTEQTPMTPKRREKSILVAIESHVLQWARENEREPKTLNGIIVKQFGKRRPDMTEEELKSVWTWINREYPLMGGATW